jgi:hypothetical protein
MRKFEDLKVLTLMQQDILIGSLLGDGSIRKPSSPNANCSFTKNQCNRFKDYVFWHFDHLKPYSSSVGSGPSKKVVHKDNGQMSVLDEIVNIKWIYRSKAHPVFTDMRNKWYPHGKKIVPTDLRLSLLALAIWYCDDGQNVPQRRCAYLHTQSFTFEECEFLVSELKHLGISSRVSHHRNLPIIRINSPSYLQFISMIKPYVEWTCFHYKVDTSLYCPNKCKGSKIKSNEVVRLIDMCHKDKRSQRLLAEEFGISKSHVSKIIRGERWPELNRPLQSRLRSNNKSGYVGVCWDNDSGKWLAYCTRLGKKIKLGRYSKIDDAIAARKEAKK